MFKDKAEARALAAEYLPEELVGKALSYVTLEEIGAEPGEPGDTAPGASRIGGCPDLPEGVQWPAPTQAFIGQINLAELHRATDGAPSLPSEGLLSFFWDPENGYDATPDTCSVLYSESTADLVRADLPTNLQKLHEEGKSFSELGNSPFYALPRPLSFYRGLAAPSYGLFVPEHEAILAGIDSDHPFGEHLDDFLDFISASSEFSDPEWKRFQILGAPCPIQPDPRSYIEEPGSDLDWILLLQVPLHAWEMDAPAEGDLYFFVHKDDLARRDFTGARAVYQQT